MPVNEYSGLPVTAKSTADPDERADRRQRGVDDALAPRTSRAARPQPVQPGEQPRLRAQQPGRARAAPARRRAAARRAQLEHRRPDDEREVRDVDVAAGGEEREVEARARAAPPATKPTSGVNAVLPERVEPDDEHDERRDRAGDQHAVGAVAEQRQQRAERDRQRMLGRRAVGLEGQRVEVDGARGPTAASRPSRSWDTSGRRRSRRARRARARRAPSRSRTRSPIAAAGRRPAPGSAGDGARRGRAGGAGHRRRVEAVSIARRPAA